MCIEMFRNTNISLICRIICLLTFIMVILLVDNLYSLAILTIVIFIIGINKSVSLIILLILHIIGFMIGYFYSSYVLFRLLLVISYCYYFLKDFSFRKKNITYSNIYDNLFKKNKDKLLNISKEGDLIDKIVKDKTDYEYQILKDKIVFSDRNKVISMQEIFYVCVHMAFLFLSIVIGSCVI